MRRTAWVIGIALILAAWLTEPASAVPDFAQQIGQPCSQERP
jgi:hypothetical protein